MEPAAIESSTGLRGMTVAALAMALATSVASAPAQAYGTPIMGVLTALGAPLEPFCDAAAYRTVAPAMCMLVLPHADAQALVVCVEAGVTYSIW